MSSLTRHQIYFWLALISNSLLLAYSLLLAIRYMIGAYANRLTADGYSLSNINHLLLLWFFLPASIVSIVLLVIIWRTKKRVALLAGILYGLVVGVFATSLFVSGAWR
jgi:undecaprenyl pyrophosphate phosphatase UppP